MPKFGTSSKLRLTTCHPDIRAVMNESIKVIDFSIICGRRDEEQQTAAHAAGMSQVQWPDSTHNTDPSEGIDIAPWPIDWNNREQFTLVAGIILGVAHTMGIDLRWGGSWSGDLDVDKNRFDDLGHFERLDKSHKV